MASGVQPEIVNKHSHTGIYLRNGEVLSCDFGDRTSIVNPTDRPVRVKLKGTHRTANGEVVVEVILRPHSHIDVFEL